MPLYALTHEFVGGEEGDCPRKDIVSIHPDIVVLSDLVPIEGFQAVDPEWFEAHPSWGDYNMVECYVITRFDEVTGLPDDVRPTIFWSLKDLELDPD